MLRPGIDAANGGFNFSTCGEVSLAAVHLKVSFPIEHTRGDGASRRQFLAGLSWAPLNVDKLRARNWARLS